MQVWYVRYVVLRSLARRSVHPMRARRQSSITTVKPIPSSRPRPG